jgi:hypothetical protein
MEQRINNVAACVFGNGNGHQLCADRAGHSGEWPKRFGNEATNEMILQINKRQATETKKEVTGQ